MSIARLSSIHVGKVAPLGPERVPSGFIKHRTEGVVPAIGAIEPARCWTSMNIEATRCVA
jgi:hypothetical protein